MSLESILRFRRMHFSLQRVRYSRCKRSAKEWDRGISSLGHWERDRPFSYEGLRRRGFEVSSSINYDYDGNKLPQNVVHDAYEAH